MTMRSLRKSAGFALAVLVAGTQPLLAAEAWPFRGPPKLPATQGNAPASSLRPVPNPELVYTAVPRCRIFGTGSSTLAASSLATYQITGTTGIDTQGGHSGGCGIPASATAVSLSITTSKSTTNGSLWVYPSTATSPALRAFSTMTGKTLTSEITAALGTDGKINVKPITAATALDATVSGYFAPPIAGLIGGDGTTPIIYSGAARIVSVSRLSTGVIQATIDRDVTYCTPTVTPYFGIGVYASAYAFNSNIITIYTWNLNSTAAPVLTNIYVYLSVSCG